MRQIDQPSRARWAFVGRGMFVTLAAIQLAIGLWAQVLPESFYRSFPGSGWHWISAAGAYNEHLIRDFGGLSLALAVVTLVAAVLATRSIAATACAAWEVFSIPHLAFHASHLDELPPAQNAVNIASLAATVAVPLLATALVWSASDLDSVRARSRTSKDRQWITPLLKIYWAAANRIIRPVFAGRVGWWVASVNTGPSDGLNPPDTAAGGPADTKVDAADSPAGAQGGLGVQRREQT